MEGESLRALSEKLDAIIKLMVFRMTEGKTQKDQIRLLSGAGFKPKAIAQTLGTTGNTVNVALANMRKMKVKKARKQ